MNLNTASRDVLLAVGLPTLADELLQFRAGGHYLTALSPNVTTDNPAVPAPIDPASAEWLNALPSLQVRSDTFTIRATGILAKPAVRQRVEAVVRRSDQGMYILAWRES